MRPIVISTSITLRDDNLLDRYFHDVGKIIIMSLPEEEILCRRIAEGDHLAMSRLVVGNLRFVISVAKKYQTTRVSLSDLISAGNIGLINAAQRFDHTKGFRFISYAVWYIRQAIISALEQHTRLIHMPLNQVRLLSKVIQTKNKLEQNSGRIPSTEEIANELGVDKSLLQELLFETPAISSLDLPIYNDSAATLHDVIPLHSACPEKALIYESIQTDINTALKILTSREREVVIAYFGLKDGQAMRLDELAGIFGLCVEQTRRIKDKALEKLRNSVIAPRLKSSLLDISAAK